MPKHIISGLCKNTNEDVTALINGQKILKVARKWHRFVKLDRVNWKHGDASDVLCGGHFRQPDDFIFYGQFSFHTQPIPRVNVPE